MLYRICVPYVSLRGEPSNRSELVSQLLFGDYFSIISASNGWSEVQNLRDGYIGYIQNHAEAYIEVTEKQAIPLSRTLICTNRQSLVRQCKRKFYVSLGSTRLTHPDFQYFNSDWQLPLSDYEFALQLLKRELMGAPYLWGGKTYFGLDCSGFVQLYGTLLGRSWPRNSAQQAGMLPRILDYDRMERGDLVFFKNDNHSIHHTGIYLGRNEILHASIKVKIEKITEKGIINEFTGSLSHLFDGFIPISALLN